MHEQERAAFAGRVFSFLEAAVDFRNKAESVRLFSLVTPQMRAFHMTWVAFFLCFFAWFGIAPLMPIVRQELSLSPAQVKWCKIGRASCRERVEVEVLAVC